MLWVTGMDNWGDSACRTACRNDAEEQGGEDTG